MSPLTKLFVGLQVVLSLLLTAAIIVYVNKEDKQIQTLKQTQASLVSKTDEANRLTAALAAKQQEATALQQQNNTQARQMSEAATASQQQIADLNVQLAKASSTVNTQLLDISRLGEALKASQDTTGKLQNEVAGLRKNNDAMVRQTSDLNARVSDLTNKLEVTEKERKFLAEQLTEAQGQNQRLAGQLNAAGISQERLTAEAQRVGPAIVGAIRDVKVIAGSPYATISVGSADQVAPGMQFKVVDRTTGDYYGALTVVSVEPNEATGRLEGPRRDQIKPGGNLEVRTQL